MYFFIDSFTITAQSPNELLLQEGDVVPLFAVANGHNVTTEYEWSDHHRHTGTCSPVLLVDTPGLYKCVVKCPTNSVKIRMLIHYQCPSHAR